MKTDFNFKRINLLFRKEWEEKRWYYLATLLVYYSCTTILFIWTSLTTISEHLDNPEWCIQRQEITCFFIIMLLSLLVAASRGTAFFSDCNDKRGSTGFLTLPASIQEKFFVKWLYTVPLTFCAFLICVLLADYTRVFICSQIYPEVDICQPLQWNTDEHNFYSWTLLLLFLINSFVLLMVVFLLLSFTIKLMVLEPPWKNPEVLFKAMILLLPLLCKSFLVMTQQTELSMTKTILIGFMRWNLLLLVLEMSFLTIQILNRFSLITKL